MEQEEADYIARIDKELRERQKLDLASQRLEGYNSSNNTESSLVKWQLNLEEEKERIFHILKGDRKLINDNGEEVWISPKVKLTLRAEQDNKKFEWYIDEETNKVRKIKDLETGHETDCIDNKTLLKKPDDAMFIGYRTVEVLDYDNILLNDYGINYVMGLLEAFMNRNIILSNFDEVRMHEICLDLMTQITEDIYNDYERMGLDTDEKLKKFPIIVMKVWVNIEAALRRALGGRENLNLRKIISVNQTDNPSSPASQPYPMVSQKKRSILRPWTLLG
jgi:hypothetical protein